MGNSGSNDYSDKGSFSAAFQNAHNNVGSGQTFTYNGKSYSTDCKDGESYRGEMPNQSGMYQMGRAEGYSVTDVSSHHVPGFSDAAVDAMGALPAAFSRDYHFGYAQGAREGYNETNPWAKTRRAL